MTTLADGGEVENYFASFAQKVCNVFAVPMAWDRMDFEHDAFLKRSKTRETVTRDHVTNPNYRGLDWVSTVTHGTACWTTPQGCTR